MSSIPAGYQLSIMTWENDADNYMNETINGLTAEDVKFYICFLNYFKPLGNKEWNEGGINHERVAIEKAYKECPPTSPKLLTDVQDSIEGWKVEPDESYDWVNETLGTWFDGEYYRVLERIQVHYIEKPIMDVSNQFLSNNQ